MGASRVRMLLLATSFVVAVVAGAAWLQDYLASAGDLRCVPHADRSALPGAPMPTCLPPAVDWSHRIQGMEALLALVVLLVLSAVEITARRPKVEPRLTRPR